jgi:hypothetical protein
VQQIHLPCHEAHTLIPVQALQLALERQNVSTTISPLRKRIWRGVAKTAGWLGIRRVPLAQRNESTFFHLNHPWRNALYPYCLTRPCVTYSFDCWPGQYDAWAQVFNKNRVRTAFISARQSADAMSRRCPTTEFQWLPEAVDPDEYSSELPLMSRPIAVLELGRRFESYHQRIKDALHRQGLTHIYPERNRGLVFQSNKAVQEAVGKAQICICFPQSITHPERAGNVETATLRYFEAMAAKCVLLGHCPKELEDLFGYNPVIQANLDNAASQLIDDILPRITHYQTLVDRNYQRLLEVGAVHHRASAIVSTLRRWENGRPD